MQIWRFLFATAVLFVIGVVVQILLAGWGIAGLGGQGMDTHIEFGYTLSLAPVVRSSCRGRPAPAVRRSRCAPRCWC